MFWFSIALMTLAALALLAWPLVRHRRVPEPREAYDLAVYRDQLRELDSDLARGVITIAEAEGARLEIQRRMLKLAVPRKSGAEAAPSAPVESWSLRRLAPWGALGLALPALAIGLYVTLGSPNLPAQRFAEAPHGNSLDGQSMESAVASLKERLSRNPTDIDGWLLLGRSSISLQRYGEAVAALKRAVALSGDKPEVVVALAEAMVFEGGGVVTPEARQLFERVRAASPQNHAALYYVGMAEAQAGDPKAALATWETLAAITPGNAFWRDDLVTLMKRAASELGVEPKVLPPLPETPAVAQAESGADVAPGPSAEDMAAAAEMAPEDRQAMITTMVERLAARLKESPDDLAGWRRLANAHRVQGDEAKAKEADAQIARLEAKGGAQTTPGPSADDMAAAEAMSPADRQAMIRSMVEGLAARLEATPDDLEGWKRLANSYRVLGELAKAVPAYKRVAELAPDDAEAQAAYARAILDGASSPERMPAEAVTRYERVLELMPNHPDALWVLGHAAATAEPPDPDTARRHWQKLLTQLEPGSEPYKSVETALKNLPAE